MQFLRSRHYRVATSKVGLFPTAQFCAPRDFRADTKNCFYCFVNVGKTPGMRVELRRYVYGPDKLVECEHGVIAYSRKDDARLTTPHQGFGEVPFWWVLAADNREISKWVVIREPL
jgi:hypothetical protein